MQDSNNIYTVFVIEEYVHADGTRELLQSKIAESISLAEAKELQDNKLSAGIVAGICPSFGGDCD